MGSSRKPYEEMMADRPEKFSPEDVDYRKGTGGEICGRCLHFYERKIDRYGVCEILRLEDDAPIEETKVCDYYTHDGKNFPLLDKE